MISTTMLWGYLELSYKLNVTWLTVEGKKLRKQRFEQVKHFLKREYPKDGNISGWSVLFGGLTGIIFNVLIIEAHDWISGAIGLFIGFVFGIAHLTISNFSWKVKMLKRIQFKREILPLDEKYVYDINDLDSKRWPRAPYNLFFEHDLGLQNSILSNDAKENLKSLCFDYIEELRTVLNSDVKKYSELKNSTKELFEVEWSIHKHFKYGGSYIRHRFPAYAQWNSAQLFYSIGETYSWEQHPKTWRVRFVVLSLPECFLLKLV